MQARGHLIPPLTATMSDADVDEGTSILTSFDPLGEITNSKTIRHGIVRRCMPTNMHQSISVTGHKTFEDTPQRYGKVGVLMAHAIQLFLAHSFAVSLALLYSMLWTFRTAKQGALVLDQLMRWIVSQLSGDGASHLCLSHVHNMVR